MPRALDRLREESPVPSVDANEIVGIGGEGPQAPIYCIELHVANHKTCCAIFRGRHRSSGLSPRQDDGQWGWLLHLALELAFIGRDSCTSQ